MLGDHEGAVGVDLGDGEAGTLERGDLTEEGVVAAGALGPALDEVPGHHATGEPVPVRA
jgi:hypothetical protein